MAHAQITQYAAGPMTEVAKLRQTWVEIDAGNVPEGVTTAASVSGQDAGDGQVWALLADTAVPDGYAIDVELDEADYLAYDTSRVQPDAADAMPT